MADLNDAISANLANRPRGAIPKSAGNETPDIEAVAAISPFSGQVTVSSVTWRSELPAELTTGSYSNSFPNRPQGALECLSIELVEGDRSQAFNPYSTRTYQVIGQVI